MSELPLSAVILDLFGLASPHNHLLRGGSLYPAPDIDVRLITIPRRISGVAQENLRGVAATYNFDRSSILGAARFLESTGGTPIERVIATTEELLLPAAQLREDLDIVGDRPDDVLPFRDKVVMKQLLNSAGIPVPAFSEYSLESCRALLRQYGKIIAKPRSEAGSVGVQILDSEDEVQAFNSSSLIGRYDYEVEEFIEGELYHIDSVVEDGVILAATAGHSIHPTVSYRSRDAHYWDIEVPPGDLFDRLLNFNSSVLAVYGDFSGVTHHEVFVRANGEVVFCEIGKRWGGGGTRASFYARTGLDIVEATVLPQMGLRMPKPTTLSPMISGYVMVYASGRTLLREPPLDLSWLIHKQVRAEPGTRFSEARAWGQPAAVLSVVGASESEVAARLEEVEFRLRSVMGE